MEIFFSFILGLLATLLSFSNPWPVIDSTNAPIAEIAEVVRVIDGDTIVVNIKGQEEMVRYIGIDTPEPYRDGVPGCYSLEATARNSELVGGTLVRLVSDQENRDKYGRLLRYVYVDEMFINRQLVAEGYATILQIKPNTAQSEIFQTAEDEARTRGVGLWSAC
jgi:micrococcal nuclease